MDFVSGYNATVLAYGQTGSGKTHTMGGAQGQCTDPDDRIMGIIPRVIQDLFDGIAERPDFEFTVRASYMEVWVFGFLRVINIKLF